MMEQGVDVRVLMEDVAAVVDEPATVVEAVSLTGRPRVFSLDYVYPTWRTRGVHLDILARKQGMGRYFEAGSERKYTGWLVALAKRLVLVAANWYIKPLTDEISEYNDLIAGALADVNRNMEEMSARLEVLEHSGGGIEGRSG